MKVIGKNEELITLNSCLKSSKPEFLVVYGRRRIGKTYIIRDFLKNTVGDENFIEFNLYENDIVKETIDNAKTSKDLLFRLSALSNKPLIKGKTIIFLDDVQICSNIITAIKFLVEEGSYKYILSWSLLGTELKNIKSIPVGYLEIFQMYPLDFEELTLVDDVVHEKLIDMFHLYLIVGGMSSVLKKYLETNNLKDVVLEQNNICNLYREDISKYDSENKLYIKEIFD